MSDVASDRSVAFAANLTGLQLRLFKALQELFAHAESNLVWYHRTGRMLSELQAECEPISRGWIGALAEALDGSTSNLQKMRKFAADYTLTEAKRLDERGCN